MDKRYSQTITDFSGGMATDLRTKDSSKYALTSHFDTSLSHRLVPQYQTEAAENKTYNITRFLYAPRDTEPASTWKLYGLGENASVQCKVLMTEPDTVSWGEPNNGESASGTKLSNVFFYYKDWIYMFGGSQLKRFDVSSSAAFVESYQGITYTDEALPVHHPNDDIAYFFAANIVYKQTNNTTGWSTVLTLPTNMTSTAACAYGDYLAIACVTTGTFPHSTVFLWDRDSSLSTVTQRIDFGPGKVIHLVSLDNKLIAVMDYFTGNTFGLLKGKVLIKQASGNTSFILNELLTDNNTASLPKNGVLKDNKYYFPMKLPLNGDNRLGIWRIDGNGYASLEVVEEEATIINAIYLVGNVWWISHGTDGSVNRTDYDNPAYSTTLASVYESLINLGINLTSNKTYKLLKVGVMTEAMPSAGQIVLKYRKDENLDSTWTTIFTNTTNDSIYHKTVNIESTGATLPEFREIQLRVESTGGAILTGIYFEWEEIDKN
jgi:hypothetical protein